MLNHARKSKIQAKKESSFHEEVKPSKLEEELNSNIDILQNNAATTTPANNTIHDSSIESSTIEPIANRHNSEELKPNESSLLLELSQSLIERIHARKSYERMDFAPLTNEDEIIYLPVEGTYNRHFFTKMFMLRKHTVQNVIISDLDMIQYQIPVKAENEELIILVYGRHIITEKLFSYGGNIGTSLCDDVESKVYSHSATLKQFKELRFMYNSHPNVNISSNQEKAAKKALEAMNDLEAWIKINTKRAEEHYLSSKYRIVKWASEYKLFSIVRFWYNDAIFQYAPEWLLGQSIDIYIPSRKLGIEYQGKQHFVPIDFFGGNDKFEENVL